MFKKLGIFCESGVYNVWVNLRFSTREFLLVFLLSISLFFIHVFSYGFFTGLWVVLSLVAWFFYTLSKCLIKTKYLLTN